MSDSVFHVSLDIFLSFGITLRKNKNKRNSYSVKFLSLVTFFICQITSFSMSCRIFSHLSKPLHQKNQEAYIVWISFFFKYFFHSCSLNYLIKPRVYIYIYIYVCVCVCNLLILNRSKQSLFSFFFLFFSFKVTITVQMRQKNNHEKQYQGGRDFFPFQLTQGLRWLPPLLIIFSSSSW